MTDMTLDALKDHVAIAIKVIDIWEKRGPPLGRLEESLRMIADEIAMLESIDAAYPGGIDGIGDLATRYRALLRSMTN